MSGVLCNDIYSSRERNTGREPGRRETGPGPESLGGGAEPRGPGGWGDRESGPRPSPGGGTVRFLG